MAKPVKAQTTAWRAVERAEDKPLNFEGDIYAPLRRLRELYIQRADRAVERAERHTKADRFDNASGCFDVARGFLQAASRVAALIPAPCGGPWGEDIPVVELPAAVIGASAQ